MRTRRLFLAGLVSLLAFAAPVAAQPLFTIEGHVAALDGKTSWPIDAAALAAIGEITIKTKVVSLEGEHEVKGVLMRALLDHVGSTGKNLRAVALDGYMIDIPIEDFTAYDVVLATTIDGKPLTVRDKGPAWVIYPVSAHPELNDPVYESRSAWQLKTLIIE